MGRGQGRGGLRHAVLVAVALGLVAVAAGLSQGRAEAAAPAARIAKATPKLLDDAVAQGEIDRTTADQHLIDVFAGKGRSGKVPEKFQSDQPWDGTLPLLALRQRVSARAPSPTRARAESALAAVTNCSDSTGSLPNETTSTHFYIAYGAIGGGLNIATYLASLEAAYTKEVTSYGWAAPPAIAAPAPIGTKYPVRVDALGGGLYGFVSTVGTGAGFVGNNPNTAWNDQDAYASCMVLNNDYSPPGFPGTPQQALDATTAHEYNHSIQFGYGAISGSNVPDDTFFEGIATWMEDEVFDNANDNYNYLWPEFDVSLGAYNDSPYPTWIIFRALTERFGSGNPGGGEQVMQDFWESTSQGSGNNLGALAVALENKGITLPNAYHDAAIALGMMRTCGGGYAQPYCFEEAASYVASAGGLPPVNGSIAGIGGSYLGSVQDDYALNLVTLPAAGTYSVTLANSGGGQLQATAVCDTGSTLVRSPLPVVVGAGQSTTLTNFNNPGCVRRLAVITNQQQTGGNPGSAISRSYTLSTGPAGPPAPPVANNDSYSTFEGTPLTIAAPGVLANDTDPNGDILTATLPSAETGGTVSLSPNGSFTFTPTAAFTGAAGFSYTANDGSGGTDPATVSITVSARPTYVPLSPARLLDTRPGGTTIDGISAGGGAIAPGATRTVQVTGRGGVPVTPVAAVALNITAVTPSAAGFLTVFPTGEPRPLASNLNFSAGQVIPNLVIAKVVAGGQVSIYNASGSTHVIADVAGWFPVTPGYNPLTPARLMDTRPGATTVDGIGAAGGPIAPGGSRTLQVTGRGGVPASGVRAVVLNITALHSSTGGYFTVFPTGELRPLASNLNFVAGDVIPNLVVAKVGSGGQVSIYNDTGSTQVIADVAGWFPTTSDFAALSPARLLDTRPGATTVDGISAAGGAIAPGATRTLQVTSRGGVPPVGVGAVVLNITAVGPTAGGFFTVFPTGEPRPLASNLNFSPGQVIPNLVIAKVGSGGQVSIYNATGSTHVIADVAGWLPAVS